MTAIKYLEIRHHKIGLGGGGGEFETLVHGKHCAGASVTRVSLVAERHSSLPVFSWLLVGIGRG